MPCHAKPASQPQRPPPPPRCNTPTPSSCISYIVFMFVHGVPPTYSELYPPITPNARQIPPHPANNPSANIPARAPSSPSDPTSPPSSPAWHSSCPPCAPASSAFSPLSSAISPPTGCWGRGRQWRDLVVCWLEPRRARCCCC